MTDLEFEIKAMDYLGGNLNPREALDFEAYIGENNSAARAFEDLRTLWEDLGALPVPEPGPGMDVAFFEGLAQAEARDVAHPERTVGWRHFLFGATRVPNWALAVVFLLAGALAGAYFFRGGVAESELTARGEQADRREQLVLTLLDQPLASQRLQGISEAEKIPEADRTIIRALLKTLNTDVNVNVRLATVEALSHYADLPEVREGLIASIALQESPLVQIALAELMAALQETKSIGPIREVIGRDQTDTVVKQALTASIRQII